MKKVQANFYEPHNNINSIPAYFRQTENFKGTFSNISYSFDNTDAEWQIIGTWTKNIEKIKKKYHLLTTGTSRMQVTIV